MCLRELYYLHMVLGKKNKYNNIIIISSNIYCKLIMYLKMVSIMIYQHLSSIAFIHVKLLPKITYL